MGMVYEAFDHARGGRVALKTLRHLDARALVRFKNEFRALADLDHPNLVRLGELFGEDGRWFFSMELIEGQDFLSWVREGGAAAGPGGGEADAGGNGSDTLRDSWGGGSSTSRGWTSRGWTGRGGSAQFTPTPLVRAFTPPEPARLRAALAQLAAGVGALHAAGKVHRDIKPSNVMVTADGRVVLLDFGLVVQAGHGGRDSDTQVVGTAAYMAPEQAASRPVGPEADWYSVGAMLYEALTGLPPFTGKPLDVLMNKQRFEPPAPRQLWPDAPADLDQLAQELLRRDPGLRLPGADVLSRLGVSLGDDTSGPVATPGTQSAPFVGRDTELGALRAAWSASRALESHAVTLFVRGESGIGKTALVRHFLEGLEEPPDDALVLAGRCYERESLPFKAFDGIVDALSRHLSRLPEVEVEPLLPHDAGLLARLFPVLRRVPALAQAALVRVPSPQELRTRAFSALRELLSRLAERRAMALSIDDFQWADADSLALFNHLMHGPCPPPLLLLATVRSGAGSGATESSPTRGRPRAMTAPGVADDADIRELTLGALPPEEARGLADLLSAGHRGLDAREIAVEAGGHPLFIHELVRHLSEASSHGAGSAPLEEALWARVERLDPPARRLLEVVAVAGEPLSPQVAAEAARLERPAFARWVALLRAAHLVRAGGLRAEDTVECYHDRVRESVCAHLDAETQRRHHAAVAQALESSGQGAQDPQILVRHLEAAGETARAAELATRAARLASEALAFDRAAELLSTALRLGRPGEHEARRLRIELGDALVQAGRAAEAADAFLAAAEGADATTRLDCRRKAAEHLLATGQVEGGRETLRVVLAEFDIELPATPRRALASLLWHRLRLRLRGYGFSPRDAGEVSPRVLALIDIYRAVAAGLGMVDTLQGADFQARGLVLALRTGEPARVARALGLEASFQATQGPRAHARARELIQRMRALVGDKGDATLRAWADGSESIVRYLLGDLMVAVELSESAERIIREETTGMSWELNTVRIFRGLALRWAGLLGKLRRTCDDNVRDAARRGDRYAEATLRRVANIVWLARDNPAEAEVDLDRQPWRAPEGGYHMQNWYELRARGEIDLYRSDLVAVAARTRDGFARLRRSMLPRVRSIAAEAAWLSGRLALAQAERTPAVAATLLAEAEHHATEVERVHMPYARVWADLLRAGVARRRGDGATALQLLGTAITGAEVAQLYLCGAVAQRLHGQLEGGSVGAERFAEATRWMSGEGIHRPARMTAVVAPGFGAAPDEG